MGAEMPRAANSRCAGASYAGEISKAVALLAPASSIDTTAVPAPAPISITDAACRPWERSASTMGPAVESRPRFRNDRT